MDADRNLLFGVLALQADLIDTEQFIEACLLWTTRKDVALAELLVERGWIVPADKSHVDYLLERKLQKHGNDARASLAAIPDNIKRSLAALADDDIERSLAGTPPSGAAHMVATVDHVVVPEERYQRLRLHATGGIGRVWLAHDSDLGRDVALKELRPERAGHAALAARFLQEAQITGQLEHPGIIPVYELVRGREDRQPFYTMRFVKGRTLSEAAHAHHAKRLAGQANALELPALLSAFVTVCNSVAYAHSRGVIHRDLKGQNIILGDFGEVVVLDWGLAKLVGRPEGQAYAESLILDDAAAEGSGHTVQGQTLGTPAYMAPEQAAGRPDLIDRRTDVYGLGAILYEILTGQPPFTGSDTQEVLRRVREDEPVHPRHCWPEVPPALEAICLRALAKRPADRPAAAGDLALEIQGWQEFERRKSEEALRESEALYHSLVESLPCNVLRKDLEGRFTFANHHFCELVGCPLDQLLGKTDFDFFPPDLAEKYRRDDRNVIETSGVFEVIEEVVGVEGRRYFHVLKTAVRDAAGKVTGIQLIGWDVTARKLAEEELRMSRERFELAVMASQDGLWDWDVEEHHVWYSPQMRKMFGYDEHEFPNGHGQTEQRVHPDDLTRWRAKLHGHVDSPDDYVELEYRIRHKDGSYRWVRDRGVALRRADGKAYRIAGSREDITERKNSEDALAQERHLLHSLMDTSPDKIYFKDRDGHYIRVNKALADKFGLYDPAQALGKTVHDIFTAEYAQQTDAEEREIMRTGQPQVAKDIKETWPDGRVTWESTTKMPLRDPQGEIIGTFGISRNIAERKQSEEALRASEERYRSVIAAMQDGIVLRDADGAFHACNASAERILGLSSQEMMGRTSLNPHWRAIHDDCSPFSDESYPSTVTLSTGKPCFNVVMGVHKPDGTLTWITINSQPLFQADGRTLAGVVVSFEDITDRKRTEEALRTTTEELAHCKKQLGS